MIWMEINVWKKKKPWDRLSVKCLFQQSESKSSEPAGLHGQSPVFKGKKSPLPGDIWINCMLS